MSKVSVGPHEVLHYFQHISSATSTWVPP